MSDIQIIAFLYYNGQVEGVYDKLKKISLGIGRAILWIVVVVLIGEIVSMLLFTIKDGKFISAKERFLSGANVYVQELNDLADNNCTADEMYAPHPYLGYVLKTLGRCSVPSANESGLFGENLPLEKSKDKFVVLLSGGSVATEFGQMNPGGPRYLEEVLNAKYQSPNGKPFLVLNGALGGWKEPDQFILFSLYANALDAVVTLDGYNESGMILGTDRFEFPPDYYFSANPESLAGSGYTPVLAGWLADNFYAGLMSNVITSHSHLAYLLGAVAERVAGYYSAEKAGDGNIVRSEMKLPSDWKTDKRFEWQMNQYMSYIRMMNYIAERMDIKTAHFIQPMPLINKPLTAEEKLRSSENNNARLKDNYGRIASELLDLRKESMPIFSLLDIFANNKETIYRDHIHLNDEGYRIMANVMAKDIGGAWGLEPKL